MVVVRFHKDLGYLKAVVPPANQQPERERHEQVLQDLRHHAPEWRRRCLLNGRLSSVDRESLLRNYSSPHIQVSAKPSIHQRLIVEGKMFILLQFKVDSHSIKKTKELHTHVIDTRPKFDCSHKHSSAFFCGKSADRYISVLWTLTL